MAENLLNRAKSVADIIRYNPKMMEFTGPWFDSFGKPEMGFRGIIWGNSGNGKTRFALQFCKYLTQFGRVAYNSLEEGLSLSLQHAIRDVGMQDVARRFILLDKEPIDELRLRLKAQKSPDIIFIDSLQYTDLNKGTIYKFCNDFSRKSIVFISHADGKEPAGHAAKAARFHADIKLWVEGHQIPRPVSRYKEGICAPFVIWREGAENYWGEIDNK